MSTVTSSGKLIPAPRKLEAKESAPVSAPVSTPVSGLVPAKAPTTSCLYSAPPPSPNLALSNNTTLKTAVKKEGNGFLFHIFTGIALLGSVVFMNKRSKKVYI
jgi:hypothetical protein